LGQGCVGVSEGGIVSGLANFEEVFQGAIIAALEAGFVAERESEGGIAGEVAEGEGETIGRAGFGALVDGVLEETGLRGPEAAFLPDGGDHFLDVAVFGSVGGIELSDKLIVERPRRWRGSRSWGRGGRFSRGVRGVESWL
jgi:hypothetical protein